MRRLMGAAVNSDAGDYGGSGVGNEGGVDSEPTPSHGRRSSLSITLPPLAAVFFAVSWCPQAGYRALVTLN